MRAVEGGLVPTPTVVPAAGAVVHLSDEGDRVLKGELRPSADRRSRANALYAQAMLLQEGVANASDQEKALGLFRQVAELDPDFSDAQIKLANLLVQSGQLDEAHERLVTLLKAHPGSVPVLVELGYTQKLRGQNEDAERICAQALAADSSQTLAMRVMLEISADQDDLAGGVVHVEDILKAGTDIPASAWLTLDRLYLEYARGESNPITSEGVLRTRLPILQQAVQKAPSEADSWTELAKTYMGLGLKVDALKALQHACSINPADADLISHCGELELDLDQKAEGIRDFEKAYALNPDATGLRDKLGHLYLENKRFVDGARFYANALAHLPGDPVLEVDLGIACAKTKQAAKAQACFQDVFASSSSPVEAYLELAYFQLQYKESKQVAGTLAAAQKLFPQSAHVRLYEALEYLEEQNYDAALASFAEVRTLATGAEADALNSFFYLKNALALNLAGRKSELEGVLREGLTHYPDDPALMNELAYFWAEQGSHLPEALALSRRAGSLEPDNGPILDTCGWVYYQMGQVKDSLPYLQRAAVMTDNDPVVLQHIGDAYLKLSLRREAIATWTEALQKDPHNGDLTSRIDAAQAQATNVHLRSAPKP